MAPTLPMCIDIETGGLKKETDKISLIGTYSEDSMFIQQFHPEPERLKEYSMSIKYLFPSDKFFLVSWNGIDFDVPFTTANGLDLAPYRHLDLLPIARANIKVGGSFKKDDICRLLGIYVPRTMEGRACAIAANDPDIFAGDGINGVFEHNAIDLCATLRLYNRFKLAGWLDEFLLSLAKEEQPTASEKVST